MNGVYIQKGSPYYWIRFYDKSEFNPAKRRKSINTKIEVTPQDLKKYLDSRETGEKIKLSGTPELRKLIKQFKQGLAQRDIVIATKIKVKDQKLLSEGFEEFKYDRSVPGSKKYLKPKTLQIYEDAVRHMIACNQDKYINLYSKERDYPALLFYFDNVKIPKKTVTKKSGVEKSNFQPMGMTTRSMYTRTLKALWNYFVEKQYAPENIIEAIATDEKDPEPIPLDDMWKILNYFKTHTEHPAQYWLVKFLFLTGCRPSSAMVQLKEDIDWAAKIITIHNVKTGSKKNRQSYSFPLYKELEILLRDEMEVKDGDTGRLFDQYALIPMNYTYSLKFFRRGIAMLVKKGSIRKDYMLRQIRPTFASFAINELNLDIFTIQKLLDHEDVKITEKHYIKFNLKSVKKNLDFLNSDDLFKAGHS